MGEIVVSGNMVFLECDDPRGFRCPIRTREFEQSSIPSLIERCGWLKNQQTGRLTCPICRKFDDALQGLQSLDGTALLDALFSISDQAELYIQRGAFIRASVESLRNKFKFEIQRRLKELETLRHATQTMLS